MKNASDFWICIHFFNFIMGQANEFMTSIMDPKIIVLAVKDMLSAPIVWLNRKSWLTIDPLISTDLVVIYGNLDIFSWNTCVHNCSDKRIDSKSSIENIVYNQYFLSLL